MSKTFDHKKIGGGEVPVKLESTIKRDPSSGEFDIGDIDQPIRTKDISVPNSTKTSEPLKHLDISEIPKHKELSKEFDITEIPKRFDVTEIPKRFDVTEIPKRFDVTEIPNRVDVTEIPNRVDVSEIPNRFDVTEIPNRFDVTEIPNRVDVSKIPKIESAPVAKPEKIEKREPIDEMIYDLRERGAINKYSLRNISKVTGANLSEAKISEIIKNAPFNNADKDKIAEEYVQTCLKKYEISENDHGTLSKLYMAKLIGYESNADFTLLRAFRKRKNK